MVNVKRLRQLAELQLQADATKARVERMAEVYKARDEANALLDALALQADAKAHRDQVWQEKVKMSQDERAMAMTKEAIAREATVTPAVAALAPAYASRVFSAGPWFEERAESMLFRDVSAELRRAAAWPPFNSAHEGYSVLAEEVDELAEATGLMDVGNGMNRLWKHVKVNQKKRDLVAMRAEAIQVAAMALKIVQMIDAGRGRV